MKGPKGAVPTTRGWVDPNSGELLKSQKISQTQIDEWNGVATAPVVEQVIKPAMTMLNEAPVGNTPLEDMTKLQLEALGRQHGVELDRRKSKSDLIEEIEEIQEVTEMYK